MMNESISKQELDAANNFLENILTQRVEDIELIDSVPSLNDITDSNKVFKGKLSILFVDMRKSTDLTDELKAKKMVKIYRSFIRIVVQAVRYCGGESRQFAGDGVMGVFQDNKDSEKPETSSERAIRAARYILTFIDYCLNPKLKKYLADVAIGCGVGICTGTIMITKVGMRGKESDDIVDNEMGIAWVGSTTNYASRFCSLALPREIFIDEVTYKEISPDIEHWKKETRIKGIKSFDGYIARDYYLSLPNVVNIEPITSEETKVPDNSFIQDIFNETENRVLQFIDEISKKSSELSYRLKNVNDKENQLSNREQNLDKREQNIVLLEIEKELSVRINFLDQLTSKFTIEQIKSFGKDYLIAIVNEIKTLILKSGKNIIDGVLSWRFSIIYDAIQLYKEYYDEVCNMAKHGFRINETEVIKVIEKTCHRITLKNELEKYISTHNNERSDEYKKLLILLGD
jgi:class 3 adenylate cyclase